VKPRTHVSKRKKPTVNMKLHDKYDQLYLKLALTYIYSSNVPPHKSTYASKGKQHPARQARTPIGSALVDEAARKWW